MEKINELITDTLTASAQLDEALQLPPDITVNRDATIKRFEFTFELSWKLMQAILQFQGKLTNKGIRTSIRDAAQVGILDNPQTWFKFLDARNLSTHAYKEELMSEVYQQAKIFLPELKKLLNTIQSQQL